MVKIKSISSSEKSYLLWSCAVSFLCSGNHRDDPPLLCSDWSVVILNPEVASGHGSTIDVIEEHAGNDVKIVNQKSTDNKISVQNINSEVNIEI